MISENMDLKHVFVVLLFVSLIFIFSGCTDSENSSSGDDNFQDGIVGEWFKVETVNNVNYKTVYEFLSNLSFFSGVWDSNSSSYTTFIRGTYEINEEHLYLTTPGVNTKWDVVVMKYSISEDGNELKLYYGDSESYEVFVRES